MSPETRAAQALYLDALHKQLEAAQALAEVTRLHYEQALKDEEGPG